MAYNPPPHYNIGGPSEPQQPQSVPPAYSPLQPQQPYNSGYAPQPSVPGPPAPSPQGIPTQPGFGTQPLLQPPPAAPRKSAAVPLLVVALIVGLASAAVAVAMWLNATGDVEDLEARIADRDSQISQLEEDLEAAQAQVAELEGPAAEAEALQACIDDLNEFYATEEGSAEEAAAFEAVDVSCAGYIF